MSAAGGDLVVWHDLECGPYDADRALWRRLASEAAGPVLDVGAGTGRVALDLAAHGHEVVALDIEPLLLGALAERAARAGLQVITVVGDASGFDLGRGDFGLVIVPMQTVQLLAGRPGRAGLLASARRHLRVGGRLAMALVQDIQPFAPEAGQPLPDPDVAEHGDRRYVSQPVAVRRTPDGMRLERRREVLVAGEVRSRTLDTIDLADVDSPALEAEGAAAGFGVDAGETIPETARHIGSEVVVLRA